MRGAGKGSARAAGAAPLPRGHSAALRGPLGVTQSPSGLHRLHGRPGAPGAEGASLCAHLAPGPAWGSWPWHIPPGVREGCPLGAELGGRGAALAQRAGCFLQKNHRVRGTLFPPTPLRSRAPGQSRGAGGDADGHREAQGRRPGLLPAGGGGVAPARGTSWPAPQPPPAPLAPGPAPQLRRLRVGALRMRTRKPAPSRRPASLPLPEPVRSALPAWQPDSPPSRGARGWGSGRRRPRERGGGHPRGAGPTPCKFSPGSETPGRSRRLSRRRRLQLPGGGSRRGHRRAWEAPRRGRGAGCGVRGAVPL